MNLFGKRKKDLALTMAEEEARHVQAVNRMEKLLSLAEALLYTLSDPSDFRALTDAISKHIDVTSTFVRRVEELYVPKLKYHIVFLATVTGGPVPVPQTQGDVILTLKTPLNTEAGVMMAKKDIQDMLKLANLPVLVSWRQLNE